MNISCMKAFTLLEVIIAAAVSSIIVLGILSSSITLQKTKMDSSNSYFLSQNSLNTLNHMITGASLAIGTPSNPGILIGSRWGGSWSSSNSVCIHQNIDPATSTDWPGTVDDTKNRWLCYTYIPTEPALAGFNPGTIYWCTMAYVPGASLYGATDCTASSNNLKALSKASSVTASFTLNTALFNVEIKSCMNNDSVNVPASSMTKLLAW